MFADGIVILASEIDTLQYMMNNLDKYIRKWNLNINLSKSKIMAFRNGAKQIIKKTGK